MEKRKRRSFSAAYKTEVVDLVRREVLKSDGLLRQGKQVRLRQDDRN